MEIPGFIVWYWKTGSGGETVSWGCRNTFAAYSSPWPVTRGKDRCGEMLAVGWDKVSGRLLHIDVKVLVAEAVEFKMSCN